MNRKIPQEVVIQTLFGPAIATKHCNTCGVEKYIHEFYCESSSKKRKIPTVSNQVRDQCIDCWTELQGRKLSYKR